MANSPLPAPSGDLPQLTTREEYKKSAAATKAAWDVVERTKASIKLFEAEARKLRSIAKELKLLQQSSLASSAERLAKDMEAQLALERRSLTAKVRKFDVLEGQRAEGQKNDLD